MPNPASVYCEENGGTLQIGQDDTGGQVGICVFPDGKACDEWAYFRGECTPTGSSPNDVPASAFPTFPTPLPVDPADYAGWSTYTHPDFGFSFQFPKDWTVDETISDGLLSGHMLMIHPKDDSMKQYIRMTFRRQGQDVLLWPSGAGEGEFVSQGTLEIAGAPARRIILVCPSGFVDSIWYHGDSDTHIQRGDLEFGLIFGASEIHCQAGYIVEGTVQQLGETIIASLTVP